MRPRASGNTRWPRDSRSAQRRCRTHSPLTGPGRSPRRPARTAAPQLRAAQLHIIEPPTNCL
eukprot:3333326-Pyramimonas_sp.AAC.1